MTSQRIRTGWPIPYGTTGQSASAPPAERSDDARPTRQPGSWWPRRRVGLSFPLPTQAPHDATRCAAEADPVLHRVSPLVMVNDEKGNTHAPTENAGTPANGAPHEF